jgi:thiol-disulfide isomerase/thioredoxin
MKRAHLLSTMATVIAITALSSCSPTTDVIPLSNSQIEQVQEQLEGANNPGVRYIQPRDRTALPILSGFDLDGAPIEVPNSQKQVTVINAWASWCPPCKVELPEFAQVAKDPEFANIRFVGLNVNDELGAAQSISQVQGYPSMVDPDGELLAQIPNIPPQGLPSTVILDPNGLIATTIIGAVPPGELAAIITRVLQE